MRRGMGCAGLVCGALGLAAGLCALFFDFFISPSLDYDSPFNYLTTFFWLFNTLLIGLAVCFVAAGLLAKEPDPAAPRPPDQPPPLPRYNRPFAAMPGFSGGLVTPAVAVPPLPLPSEAPPPVSVQTGEGDGEASPEPQAEPEPAVAETDSPSKPPATDGLPPASEESAPDESTSDDPAPEKKLFASEGESPAGKEADPDTSSSSGSPAEGDELPFPEQPPRKNPLG